MRGIRVLRVPRVRSFPGHDNIICNGMKTETANRPLEGRWIRALFLAALSAATLGVYWQTTGFGFLRYDDPEYISDNLLVRSGLTLEGLSWAFTTFHFANWHPVTWLSHMSDVSLFGMGAGWHHLASAILHCANAVLLFLAARRLTGASLRSGIVAALFALHPLHVESVAWLSERKDVLSGLFFMLTLLAYDRYVRRGGAGRYLGVVAFFALGLMAKAMLVTLPFVLLLLDFWPLGRTSLAPPADGSERKRTSWGHLLLEKVPLLAMALASSAVTVAAQRTGGTVAGFETLPAAARGGNAVVSYALYLYRTFIPASLGVFYPHPGGGHPAWKIVSALLLVVAISAFSFRKRREYPWLIVGWLWFLGMLVPVIGLVQIGAQAMADRYTYLPLIGVFVVAAWGSALLVSRTGLRNLLAPLWTVALVSLAILSWRQAGTWRDTETVFRRAVAVTGDNWVAHLNLGWAVEEKGRLDEAEWHYREVLRIDPSNPYAHNNIGAIRFRQDRFGEAVHHFREALRRKPDYAEARTNLEKVRRTAFGQGVGR